MLAMLSDTASSHLRYTVTPVPATPIALNVLMSGPLDGVAQHAVLAVQSPQGQLVAHRRVDVRQRLLVEVDVASVEPGGLERRPGARRHPGRRCTPGDGAAQRVLEFDLTGLVAGGLDVGDVVGDGGLPGREAGNRDAQGRRREIVEHSSSLESVRAPIRGSSLSNPCSYHAVRRGPESAEREVVAGRLHTETPRNPSSGSREVSSDLYIA